MVKHIVWYEKIPIDNLVARNDGLDIGCVE
jgi:hypothetical protein